MSFIFYLFLFLFLILSVFMIMVILVQDSKSMGLGASFGGDSSDSLFGTSTADVLKKFTGYLVAIFFAAGLILSIWTGSLSRKKTMTLPTEIEEVSE